MFNEAMIYVGWLTTALLCWFLGWCLWQIIKELAGKLYWKAKVKTLHYKLYIHDVVMTIVPIHDDRFMISFKCEGYEDWFFYANVKSWKEIGAVASKNWSRYLAEREKAIDLTEATDVDLDELFGTKEYVEDLEKRFAEKGIMPVKLAGKSCVSKATDAMKAMADAAEAYAERMESSGESGDSDRLRPATDGGEE